ncbi:hypothetical protein [Marinobacter zhejiangensis]|uniref:Uncharacterized protein n=1 Tax=Marinobacter zhejiangensis TaxID=488535 RepID=A0A1I4Q0C7_9GAMM|nr:hypothetical protein [Marinobacter zhejiangensis]SFM33103.1 hypothetical protein SAMN04487963_2090 [Marinobacter zhejiangensis]
MRMNRDLHVPLSSATPSRLALVAPLLAMTLAGCGGSSSDDDNYGHDHTEIESAGRLALFDTGTAALKVLDLDQGAVLASFALPGEAPRLYASPDHRYGVIVQRGDDRVSFLDSGLYTEDHGDHLHDYAETPVMLNLTLNDHRPTHYTQGEDHGVVFFDGSSGTASARVTVFSDISLGGGSALASLERENNMHGVAKLLGDQLFVTYRDPSITDTTLPAEVERYSLDGDTFAFENRYTEQCPLLHGTAANDHVLGFGCSDGVLVIDLQDASYGARKLANPATLAEGSRIGTLAGHNNVEALVGIAGDQLFVINAEAPAEPYQMLDIGAGIGRVIQGFDGHGETFYVLGDDGKLRLFDPAANWSLTATLAVTQPLTEGSTTPAIVTSAAGDRLFVLDPDRQRLIEIDSHDGDTVRTLDLGFTPAASLAWLGLAADQHGEDGHDH